MRRQQDPARDAQLTVTCHRRLACLLVPRRPIDGVPVPLNWLSYPWPIVRLDVRMLMGHRRHSGTANVAAPGVVGRLPRRRGRSSARAVWRSRPR